jgi:hypothetical protein
MVTDLGRVAPAEWHADNECKQSARPESMAVPS